MLSKREMKIIDMIDFEFLELLSGEKGWNNYFYEIFKLLSNSEYIYEEEYKFLNLNIVIMDQIIAYVKYVNKKKIVIIENDIFLVRSDKGKYIVFCTGSCDENQALLVRELYKKVSEFLLLNKIRYELSNDEITILDADVKQYYKINNVIKLLDT